MPRDKDLKRLVRARMKKTGEAYTTARAQVLKKPRTKTAKATKAAKATRTTSAAADPITPAPLSASSATGANAQDYPTLAGMRDEVIEAKTGRDWARWVETLDAHAAADMSHRDIAALVHRQYDVSGWWSQSVTVGYERIKGLRARGQRRDGGFEAGKSRTYDVPVTTLFDAWANARIRKRWLDGATVKVRTATAPKSIRLGWDDGTIVVVGFMAKGTSKSAVALAHTKLPDKETADRLKQYWAERLDALGEVLSNGKASS